MIATLSSTLCHTPIRAVSYAEKTFIVSVRPKWLKLSTNRNVQNLDSSARHKQQTHMWKCTSSSTQICSGPSHRVSLAINHSSQPRGRLVDPGSPASEWKVCLSWVERSGVFAGWMHQIQSHRSYKCFAAADDPSVLQPVTHVA